MLAQNNETYVDWEYMDDNLLLVIQNHIDVQDLFMLSLSHYLKKHKKRQVLRIHERLFSHIENHIKKSLIVYTTTQKPILRK